MTIYINDSNAVKEQYSSSGSLSTRISIHDKYSTNKTGFGNWIFSNYDICEGMKVLELGCGTGSMWKGHEDAIRRCGELVLSDFSEAMVEKAKETIGDYPNVTYKQIDIMDIPFEDDAFDVVIANMMLYHVPDISRGLEEVRRVLKADGSFYCATFGIHGIMEYISGLLSDYGVKDETSRVFTLQNGEEVLGEVFANIRREDYIDSLAVTDVDDMVSYIYSLKSMTTLTSIPREVIRDRLKEHMKDGVMNVPKEYGMFIAGGAR